MKKIMNLLKFIFKPKDLIFNDGSKIIFSGKGGLTYISKDNKKIYLGWLWEEDPASYQKNKNVDLIIDKKLLKWHTAKWKNTKLYNSLGTIDNNGNKVFSEIESKKLLELIKSRDWDEEISDIEKKKILEKLLFYCDKYNIVCIVS